MKDFDELPGMWEHADFIDTSDGIRRDLSGRPKPEDVRVKLNSGIVIKCDVRFDGYNPDHTRRYLVVAELDWENYWPAVLMVGLYPSDVTLLFKMPDDMTDTEGYRRTHSMRVDVEKIVNVQ